MKRVDEIVARAGHSVASVDQVVGDAAGSVTRVDEIVDAAGRSVARVDAVVDGASSSVARVDATVGRADGLVTRADALLAQAQGPLEQLMPALQRLAETLHPTEIDAAILLIDRLPELLGVVDSDVLPLMRQLGTVAPELHEMLRLVEDLHNMVAGLPGMGRLRKRGEQDDDS